MERLCSACGQTLKNEWKTLKVTVLINTDAVDALFGASVVLVIFFSFWGEKVKKYHKEWTGYKYNYTNTTVPFWYADS